MPRIADFGLAAVSVFCVLLVVYIAYKWWERMRFYSVLRMAQIEVGDLHKLMGTPPPPLVIDVRSATAVQLEPRCIPGSLHIPLTEVQQHLRDLPRDRDIISYCTCPNEASAAQVAKVLMDNGFKKVRPLHGGLDAWVAAGYTVDTLPVSAVPGSGSVLRGSVIS